jgi:hypothetical protein
MAFVDLEKPFDRVWWALRSLGVNEGLATVLKSMYADTLKMVKLDSNVSKEFEVKVGVHQGSVLSPLLFIIVLEALSQKFRGGLPMELLYADSDGRIRGVVSRKAKEVESWYGEETKSEYGKDQGHKMPGWCKSGGKVRKIPRLSMQ